MTAPTSRRSRRSSPGRQRNRRRRSSCRPATAWSWSSPSRTSSPRRSSSSTPTAGCTSPSSSPTCATPTATTSTSPRAASRGSRAPRATASTTSARSSSTSSCCPRTIVPLDGNSILTNETASDDVIKWTDTNNDGVADKREHFYLRHRPRPRRQPRARAGRLRLGPRQLDLHDLQRVPLPLDADRHPQGTHRPEWRPVGRDDG